MIDDDLDPHIYFEERKSKYTEAMKIRHEGLGQSMTKDDSSTSGGLAAHIVKDESVVIFAIQLLERK